MATLYDMELQESNNFIHALIASGETPALKLFLDQKQQAESMGEAGAELLKMFEPEGEMGKSLTRLENMKTDIQAAMTQVKMEPELAKKANSVLEGSPESMEELSEESQTIVKDYWLKKKSIIVILLQKGYTHEELFS